VTAALDGAGLSVSGHDLVLIRQEFGATFLDPDGLKGSRLGVLRALVDTEDADPEVIALFERFDVPDFFKVAQLMFTDKSGDSAILEGDHVLRKQGDYQITTNFYQSERRAKPYPWRYATIDGMLSAGTVPTVDDFRGILAASHQEGRISTIYSNIYDLKAGLVHLYHFHNFEEVVTIDLAAELAKGRHEVEIASLFPESFAFATFKARHGD